MLRLPTAKLDPQHTDPGASAIRYGAVYHGDNQCDNMILLQYYLGLT